MLLSRNDYLNIVNIQFYYKEIPFYIQFGLIFLYQQQQYLGYVYYCEKCDKGYNNKDGHKCEIEANEGTKINISKKLNNSVIQSAFRGREAEIIINIERKNILERTNKKNYRLFQTSSEI